MPKYLFHHQEHVFYHQISLNVFCLCRIYQFHVNGSVFFSFCVSQLFYLKKTSMHLLCLNFKLIPFSILNCLSFSAIIEYILDFKPTDSTILTPFSSSVIFPSTFLLKSSQYTESFGYPLKSNKFLSLKH